MLGAGARVPVVGRVGRAWLDLLDLPGGGEVGAVHIDYAKLAGDAGGEWPLVVLRCARWIDPLLVRLEAPPFVAFQQALCQAQLFRAWELGGFMPRQVTPGAAPGRGP